jgi:tetratricopeptide (TPR) repeat protein
MYFQNNTGDRSLDWLCTALTDMMVTGLSQSPYIEVLATNRLYEILKDMNRLDEHSTSFDVVQELAERGQVETALVGSFVKVGESIRISVSLQEVASGKILTTEKVEGVGESSIFPMVDSLTRRIKGKFEIGQAADTSLDRGLKDVTTPSLQAYRYYAEGIQLHERGKYKESIPFYEKAIAVDPGFAMALSKLSRAHYAIGHSQASEQYARRAHEHVSRLSSRERFYVEGNYYGAKEENYGRAIEAYKKALELYPDHASARFNLARRYLLLEHYDEAIEELKELRRRGSTLPEVYGDLSFCYAARGEFDNGYQVLKEFLDGNPDSSAGHFWLGLHLTRWGKLQEALEAFEMEALLAPEDDLWAELGRWYVFVTLEQWEEAESAASNMAASTDNFMRWSGFLFQAMTHLYGGRSVEALNLIEQANRESSSPGLHTADSRSLAAYILLEKLRVTAALEQAQEAQREGKGHRSEWNGLFLAALAQARLGRWDEAEKTAKELRRKADSLATERVKTLYHHLEGELALDRGDVARALHELEQARLMLPVRGFPGPPTESPPGSHIPLHVPIWFSMATACWANGEVEKAANWFQQITESSGEHINWPIPYVRSFYFLGKLYENRGEMDQARGYYRRFYEYWKDGDMDRERVGEALSKLQGT